MNARWITNTLLIITAAVAVTGCCQGYCPQDDFATKVLPIGAVFQK